MATANARIPNLVIVLMGPAGGSDAPSWGIANGHIVHIPGNNPELRNLVAAATAVNAVEIAGENTALSALNKAAQSAMLDAAGKLAAVVH